MQNFTPLKARLYQSDDNLSFCSNSSYQNVFKSQKSNSNSQVEASRSITTLMPGHGYNTIHRQYKWGWHQKRFDKFGNELPVWAKAEEEDGSFDNRPYGLDISNNI